jgi:peptide/nickel transport system ATP-binding protein
VTATGAPSATPLAAATGTVLEARSVGKVFAGSILQPGRKVKALNDFSLRFDVADPAIVALAGQSGSGKTTAAQLLLGLASPSAGKVFYAGTDVGKLGRGRRRQFRRDVQAVLQDPYASFNPVFRVSHVFDVAARNFRLAGSAADRRRLAAEALEYVGLDPDKVLRRYPHELSGGERQRVMIARALMLRPRVIVADEPVSMVDASIRSAILEIILRLKKKEGISFLYVTHDLSTAYHVADELVVLYKGETVERGPARTVIENPSHSYTRLLIDSVPVPDPSVRWGTPAPGRDGAPASGSGLASGPQAGQATTASEDGGAASGTSLGSGPQAGQANSEG